MSWFGGGFITVVLNTSSFSAIKEIKGFNILKRLFPQNIVVPTGVIQEFSQKYRKIPPFVTKQNLDGEQRKRADTLNLGIGEREAIVLAEDLNAVLVIEDRKARDVCRERKIEFIGTYGVIRQAYIDCIISRKEMTRMMERLKRSLYYSDQLIEWVLKARKRGAS